MYKIGQKVLMKRSKLNDEDIIERLESTNYAVTIRDGNGTHFYSEEFPGILFRKEHFFQQ